LVVVEIFERPLDFVRLQQIEIFAELSENFSHLSPNVLVVQIRVRIECEQSLEQLKRDHFFIFQLVQFHLTLGTFLFLVFQTSQTLFALERVYAQIDGQFVIQWPIFFAWHTRALKEVLIKQLLLSLFIIVRGIDDTVVVVNLLVHLD
jgi:hypothetical protein